MKNTLSAIRLVIASSVLSSNVSASVTMDWVTVGNAGNSADPLTGYGAVGYDYKIGKYEVTNAQYGAFLNATAQTDSYGLYNASMSSYGISRRGSFASYTYSVTSSLANRPVAHVSWFDAARFANWMMNGQGSGSTETGAYTLNGATSGIILANAGAQVYIPTEDEWYKAAYYNGDNSTYSLFPNGLNNITTSDANYNSSASTDVGSYGDDASSYGTYDQAGNVYEWNDSVILGASRGARGGNMVNDDSNISSLYRAAVFGPAFEDAGFGFRLASVPEPTPMLLSMFAGGMMLIRRKR